MSVIPQHFALETWDKPEGYVFSDEEIVEGVLKYGSPVLVARFIHAMPYYYIKHVVAKNHIHDSVHWNSKRGLLEMITTSLERKLKRMPFWKRWINVFVLGGPKNFDRMNLFRKLIDKYLM